MSRSIPSHSCEGGRNLESPPWSYVLWGVPAAIIMASLAAYQASALSIALAGSLWTLSVAWIGIGCFMNGRSCGRVHCKIDGIAMPALAVVGLLNVVSVIPFNWNLFWIAFFIILTASFVAEFVWKRYSEHRSSSKAACGRRMLPPLFSYSRRGRVK